MQEGLVVIAECGQVADADLIRSVLSGEGIECFLDGEHTASWRYLYVLQRVRILVYASDAGRALELLRKEQLIPESGPTKTNIRTGLILQPLILFPILLFLCFVCWRLWNSF